MKNKKIYYLHITPMSTNVPTDRSINYGDTEIGHSYEVLDLNKERVLLLHAKNNDESADQVIEKLLSGSHIILMNGVEGQESVENRFNCSVIAHENEIAQVFIGEFHALLNEITRIDSQGVSLDYHGLHLPATEKLVHELLRDKKIIIRSEGRAEKISQCYQLFKDMETSGDAFDAQLSGQPIAEDSLDNEKTAYLDETPHLSFDEALAVLNEKFSDHTYSFNVIGVCDDVVA